MKPSDLSVYLTKMIKAKRNVLVKGSPGTGKTAIAIAAIEAAESLGILMYPSVGNPTEPRGFPWLHNGRAEFIPFGELRQLYEVIDSGKLVTLFLDDLGQGTAATQAGYMSLLDKIRGRCAVIAATNERGHTGVQGILEPVKSRFAAIVEMVPDLDDFTTLLIKHGEKLYTLSEEAILDGVSFLRFRPDLLCNYQPTADLTNSPCPRTWVAAL